MEYETICYKGNCCMTSTEGARLGTSGVNTTMRDHCAALDGIFIWISLYTTETIYIKTLWYLYKELEFVQGIPADQWGYTPSTSSLVKHGVVYYNSHAYRSPFLDRSVVYTYYINVDICTTKLTCENFHFKRWVNFSPI